MLINMLTDSLKDKKKEIATELNKRINLPFVSEEKEQILAEKVVDVLIDIIAGVLTKGKA
jgi:hypothetical protein